MEIRIGFSKRNMAFSRFLRWTERRPYSHCYVQYKNHFTEQDLVLHAAGFNIHTLTLENFKKHNNEIIKEYVFEVKDPKITKEILTFIYSVSGSPYGWIQIFGMGLVKLAAYFGKKIKNPLADGNRTMVCSEFCAHVVDKTKQVPYLDLDYAEQGGPSWLDSTLQKTNINLLGPEESKDHHS